MNHWQITSSAGTFLGTYPGATVGNALDALARDGGYLDQVDAVSRGVTPFTGTLVQVWRCPCGNGSCMLCDDDGWTTESPRQASCSVRIP